MPGRVKLTTEASEIITHPSKRKAPEDCFEARSPTKRSRPATPTSTRSSTPATSASTTPAAAPVTTILTIKPARELRKQQSKPRIKKYKCTWEGGSCDKAFARPCRLDEHMRSHTGDRPFKCTEDTANCDKSFLRDSHLKAHIKAMHHKSKTYRCTFLIPAGQEDDLGRFGFKRKASEPPNGPDEGGMIECGAGFTTNQHLKRHVESHLKTYPYTCTEYEPCQAGFRKKGPLLRHVRSAHHGLQPWACTQADVNNPEKPCEAAFDTKGKLGNHVAGQHAGWSKRRYICTTCSKPKLGGTAQGAEEQASATIAPVTAPMPTVLRGSAPPPVRAPPTIPEQEPREITPEERIKEEALDDASLLIFLSQQPARIAHTPSPRQITPPPPQAVHLQAAPPPQPPLSAPTAHAPGPSAPTQDSDGIVAFHTHSELRAHIASSHPPHCRLCPYVGRRPRDITNHMKSHAGTLDERRRHLCFWESCIAEFTTKHNLKTHLRVVHEGQKPFSCPQCPQSFGYKHVLDNHIARHNDPNKKKPKNRRKRRTRELGVVEKLTGVGYEESGRNIKCLVPGCEWRFYRSLDLRVHLGAQKAHGLSEEGIEELMMTCAKDPDETVTDASESESESESGWSVGSETETSSESEGEDEDEDEA